MQPGRFFPFTLNVTLDATEIFAVIVTVVRKNANVAEPGRANELKKDVSSRSVTVILIA
jgi:hypothetical protein